MRLTVLRMAPTGLLVLTTPWSILPNHLNNILDVVRRHVNKTLYIQLLPGQHNLFPIKTAQTLTRCSITQCSEVVSKMYSNASFLCSSVDVRVLLAGLKIPQVKPIQTKNQIDVVVFDRVYNSADMEEYIHQSIATLSPHCNVVTLDHDPIREIKDNVEERQKNGENLQKIDNVQINIINKNKKTEEATRLTDKIYKKVVLGGTFDRIHNGHKILLTEALLRCSEELTVGVTDGNMVKSKKLYELIEPCLDRLQHLRDFLQDVDPTILRYRIVPITDPYGPTKDDADLEMIVVSEETYKGGLKVNEVRKEKSLQPLDIHTIGIVEDHRRTSMEEEGKISSSSYRMRLLGSRLREPELKPDLPDTPYIIGLTGGIASGKSSIGMRLEKLGAGIVDCDKLGHLAYMKGTTCYKKIADAFGKDILQSDGEIDRKVLGSKVFADKSELAKLNNLVWPEIAQLVKKQIEKFHQQKVRVVILDAAVLLEASWDKLCHEVWVSIIPKSEAMRRIQERDNLSVEEASQRLESQMSNEERVARSHVVFSSFWAPDYTQLQVQKAWRELYMLLQKMDMYES